MQTRLEWAAPPQAACKINNIYLFDSMLVIAKLDHESHKVLKIAIPRRHPWLLAKIRMVTKSNLNSVIKEIRAARKEIVQEARAILHLKCMSFNTNK